MFAFRINSACQWSRRYVFDVKSPNTTKAPRDNFKFVSKSNRLEASRRWAAGQTEGLLMGASPVAKFVGIDKYLINVFIKLATRNLG